MEVRHFPAEPVCAGGNIVPADGSSPLWPGGSYYPTLSTSEALGWSDIAYRTGLLDDPSHLLAANGVQRDKAAFPSVGATPSAGGAKSPRRARSSGPPSTRPPSQAATSLPSRAGPPHAHAPVALQPHGAWVQRVGEQRYSATSPPRSLSPVAVGTPAARAQQPRPPATGAAAPAAQRPQGPAGALPIGARSGLAHVLESSLREEGRQPDDAARPGAGGAAPGVEPLAAPAHPIQLPAGVPRLAVGRETGASSLADLAATAPPRTPRTPRTSQTPRSPSAGSSPVWLPIGTPVTFFVEGDPQQLYGRMRSVSASGTYTVDMVGGGRRAGLDAVTRCSEAEVQRQERARMGMRYAPSSPRGGRASEASTPLQQSHESSPRVASPTRQYTAGCPVAFHTERRRLQCFGRIRQVHANGSYTIDMVDGTCRTGVEKVAKCSEDTLKEARSWKRDMHTSRPAWSDYDTRNAKPFQAVSSPVSIGCNVSLFDHIRRTKVFGRVRNVTTDGTQNSYTIDLVGGGVRDVPAVARCSDDEFARAVAIEAERHFPMRTGLGDWAEYATRNAATPPEGSGQLTPTVGGAPLTPRLRGVVIAGTPHRQKGRPLLKEPERRDFGWEGSLGCQESRMPITSV